MISSIDTSRVRK